MNEPAPPRRVHALGPMPRTGLAVACTLHALPLGWAAVELPTSSNSWLTWTIGGLAALHAAVAILALTRQQRALARTWLALSLYSIALLLGVTIVVVSCSLYLSGLYQEIGVAISAAMAGVWGLLVLLTVPVSAWGLAYTWPLLRLEPRRALIASSTLAIALGIAGVTLHGAAHAAAVPGASAKELLAQLERVALPSTRGFISDPSLLQHEPARCQDDIASDTLTLLVTKIDGVGQPRSACLQGRDASGLQGALQAFLTSDHTPGTPLKLDLVRAVQKMVRIHPLVDALALRPTLDGVCDRRACFAPWQLITRDAFRRFRPLAEAVPDAAFGVSLDELALALGAPPHAQLYRIETASSFLRDGHSEPLVGMRARVIPNDASSRANGVKLAGQHIMKAQQADGSFRYLLDPFTGATRMALNLPRQAGTTLALCELVPESAPVAGRALAQLRTFERRVGELSAISDSDQEAELGPTALPLIAFASCRPKVGPQNDELIGRLARYLLKMQRANGSFFPTMTLANGQPTGEWEPLYAGGQAVLALVLVEKLVVAQPQPSWPERAPLHDAVTRAMHFYAHDYWPSALRKGFYIEENWHCLAARAALPSHRDEDYEDFCLDYVAFKSRLILDAADGVSPERAGGYGLSDMFPPHSTATAGYGEALAAAIAVKKARGMDLQRDQARMQSALGFVLRQQWTRDNCFACAPGAEAIGGFSESEASAAVRIDYVQHAMAALGHGSAALSL